MDGEFRFFSYNKPADWHKGESFNLDLTSQGMFIQQEEKFSIKGIIRLHELDGAGEIYDFTIGIAGKFYLLDEHASLWMYDVENNHHERLFPPGHNMYSKHALIVAIDDNILFADPESEGKLSAFSITNGQLLWSTNQVGEHQLYPLAIATDRHKHVYVLIPLDIEDGTEDKKEIPEGGRLGILKLGPSGEIIDLYSDEKFVLKQRAPLHHLKKCLFIAISHEGDLFVFNTIEHILYAFSVNGELITRIFLPAFQFSGMSVDTKNNIYIGDSRNISEEGEDDRFILNFGLTGELIAKVSGFRGKVDKLLLDRKNRMYVLNRENETMTLLEPLPRTKEMEWSGQLKGVYLSTALDSTVLEMEWHKLTIDADIPEETQIRVTYFASDSMNQQINGTLLNLDAFIKDPERSSYEKLSGLEPIWSEVLINPRDALFLQAKGRYLWLKIEFFGSAQKTPVLKKFRAYYPRMSYLSYLPAMYQDDKASRDFLERFLSLFGTLFHEMEDNIQHLSRYLDTDAVGGEWLRWLGSWVGVEVDDNWSDEQIRWLIREAPTLYRQRGTRQGIEKMIEIYVGSKPFFIEHFQLKWMRDIAEWRDLADQLYGTDPYTFTVIVKPEAVDTEKKRRILQSILDEQKPAFTEARLVTLQPWIYMDMHSYLGINTYLSEPSLLSLDPKLSMPNDTLIVDFGVDRRMDIHTRLEIDSELE